MRSYELAIWQESNFNAEASDKKVAVKSVQFKCRSISQKVTILMP
jgi:hypothetical protein